MKVGEQYANDQCTGLCTCNEEGSIACTPLCPSVRISMCSPPYIRKKIRVPSGPSDSKCTCEQTICVPPGKNCFYKLKNFIANILPFEDFLDGHVVKIT